jgi:hypothetical protein
VDQTDDGQKKPDQNYTEDISTPQISAGTDFQRCGQVCDDGHYYKTLQYLPTTLLSIWFN